MKPRRYKINEMEFINNVEIPQQVDKQNKRLETIALVTISICIGLCIIATASLYYIEKLYSPTN